MKSELEILLVEDDADTRANLCDILELHGHHVVAVGSTQAALKLAETTRFCAVILDWRLPDGTAEEVLPDLKRLSPDADVIVVTGYGDMDTTIAAFRSGAADYILKPINPNALQNSLQRIIRLRQTRAELKREQEFADRILRTAEAVVLVLDLDGRVMRFNPYFERISGWAPAALTGKDWFESCIPERDRRRIRQIFLQTTRDVDTSGIINPILTTSGEERQVRWSNTTLKNDRGVTTAVLAVGIDVTDFLAAQQRMMQSERLAAIGQTMTALAHESRNALQRIHAGLEFLELELADRPESQRDLETVRKAASDLNALLEEVRSYAAPIRLHREQTDLKEVYRRAWRNLKPTWEKRQAKLIESSNGSPSIAVVDAMRMEQVFRNLFENSLAACEDPAEVEVCCRTTADKQFECTLCDNGPGLSVAQEKKIFEPFYTTKSSGTGLGMSIVKRIVEAHSGTIECQQPNPADRFAGGNPISETAPATDPDSDFDFESSEGNADEQNIDTSVASPSGACFLIRLPLEPDQEATDSCNTRPKEMRHDAK